MELSHIDHIGIIECWAAATEVGSGKRAAEILRAFAGFTRQDGDLCQREAPCP